MEHHYNISLSGPILYSSSAGTSKYFMELFTNDDVKDSTVEEHSDDILKMVLPIPVLISLIRELAITLIQYLVLDSKDFTKPIYRLASITLGWSEPEIDSMRYLWVVFGTLHACLTATFHAVNILSQSPENIFHSAPPWKLTQ